MSDATPPKAPAKSTPSKANPKATKVISNWKTDSPLVSCRFSRDGKFVFAGGQDNRIYRFDLSNGARTVIAGHESWVRDFAFLPDGQTMVACDYAGRLIWWPFAEKEPKPIRTVDSHAGWARCIAVSPDGKTLATGGNDNLVIRRNAQTGETIDQFKGHPRHVYSVFFHPKENVLLSGDLMGTVKQWDLATSKELRSFESKELHKYDTTFRADYGGVRSIDLSPDGKQLAFAGLHKCTNAFAGINEPLVMRYDWVSQKKVQSHIVPLKALTWRALFHREGFLIAAVGGSGGGHLVFWNTDAKPIHQIKMAKMARDMDLNPDQTLIATAHTDNHLRISRLG